MCADCCALPADAQGFICWGKGVLCTCAKEELRQDRSCSSEVSLLCFLLFGSPVSGAGVVLCLLQFYEGEKSIWLDCEAEHAAPSSLFT